MADLVFNQDQLEAIGSAHMVVVGASALGAEMVKNLALSGVGRITLVDERRATAAHVRECPFLSNDDAGHMLAEAVTSAVRRMGVGATSLSAYTSQGGMAEAPTVADGHVDTVLVACTMPLSAQSHINDLCRKHSAAAPSRPTHFVSANVLGATGYLFVDAGEEWRGAGIADNDIALIRVASVRNCPREGGRVCVECGGKVGHGMQDGDSVQFINLEGVDGLDGAGTVRVTSRMGFSVKGTVASGGWTGGGLLRRLPHIVEAHHSPLSAELAGANPAVQGEPMVSLHASVRGVHAFVDQAGRLPRVGDDDDARAVAALSRQIYNGADEKIIACLSMSCPVAAGPAAGQRVVLESGGLYGMVAWVGGVGSAEAIKLVAHVGTPINQWRLWQASDLVDGLSHMTSSSDADERAEGGLGATLLPRPCFERMRGMKVVVVGLGVVGQELVKNLAAMGVGCRGRGSEGGVVLMESGGSPSRHRLSSSQSMLPWAKSANHAHTLATAALQWNSAIRMSTVSNRQPEGSEQVEASALAIPWRLMQRADCVMSCGDTFASRRRVDDACVEGTTAMIDGGVLGGMGHVQPVIPHVSEQWSAFVDQPKSGTPTCVLGTTPHTPRHCVEWAMARVELLFGTAVDLISHGVEAVEAAQKEGQMEQIERVSSLLSASWLSMPECIELSVASLHSEFVTAVDRLLESLPADHVTDSGQPYWGAPLSPPRPAETSSSSLAALEFVCASCRLLAASVVPSAAGAAGEGAGVGSVGNADYGLDLMERVKLQVAVRAAMDKAGSDRTVLPHEVDMGRLRAKIGDRKYVVARQATDSDLWVDTVHAFAVLRAECFGIPAPSRVHVHDELGLVCPRFMPACAAVAGLMALELTRLALATAEHGGRVGDDGAGGSGGALNASAAPPPPNYTHTYINLFSPTTVTCQARPPALLPLPPRDDVAPSAPQPLGSPPNANFARGMYSVWDRWDVTGDLTVDQFCNHVKDTYSVEVGAIFHGDKTLYMPMLPSHSKRTSMPMVALLEEESVKAGGQGRPVDLTVSYEDSDGEDVDGPAIRFRPG